MSKSEWLPLVNNGEKKPMTDSKKQSLAILEKVYQHLSSLSDDELFDMMYKYSPNFKKQVNRIEENLKGISMSKEYTVKDGPEFWGLEGDDFILWNSIEERIEEYLDDFDESIFGPLPETLELIGYDPDPPRAENYEGSTLERLLEWLDENHKMDGEFTEETEGMKQAAHEFVEKVLSEYSSTSLKEICKKTVKIADYREK